MKALYGIFAFFSALTNTFPVLCCITEVSSVMVYAGWFFVFLSIVCWFGVIFRADRRYVHIGYQPRVVLPGFVALFWMFGSVLLQNQPGVINHIIGLVNILVASCVVFVCLRMRW